MTTPDAAANEVDRVPAPLREAIARDLRPARPLKAPFRRAMVVAPPAIAMVAAVPLLHFFRSDLNELGFFGSWGLSLFEAAGGVTVVALALRESIPGRALSRAAVGATFAAGLILPFAILAATARSFAVGSPPGAEWSDGLVCFRTSATAAIPVLLVAAALALRALPLRPVLTGALYGLGSGIVADAGLRLFCEFTVPAHVAAAHGGAILTAVVTGVVVAKLGAWISG